MHLWVKVSTVYKCHGSIEVNPVDWAASITSTQTRPSRPIMNPERNWDWNAFETWTRTRKFGTQTHLRVEHLSIEGHIPPTHLAQITPSILSHPTRVSLHLRELSYQGPIIGCFFHLKEKGVNKDVVPSVSGSHSLALFHNFFPNVSAAPVLLLFFSSMLIDHFSKTHHIELDAWGSIIQRGQSSWPILRASGKNQDEEAWSVRM